MKEENREEKNRKSTLVNHVSSLELLKICVEKLMTTQVIKKIDGQVEIEKDKGERARERETERQRDRERETDRQTDRQRERVRERERDRERQR